MEITKIRGALILALFAYPTAAYADTGPGYVSNLFTVIEDQTYLFDQSGVRSSIPSCGSGTPLRWAIDPTTPFGQSVVATLLSAYALHKQVTIIGTGTCSVHPDTETVRYLIVPD